MVDVGEPRGRRRVLRRLGALSWRGDLAPHRLAARALIGSCPPAPLDRGAGRPAVRRRGDDSLPLWFLRIGRGPLSPCPAPTRLDAVAATPVPPGRSRLFVFNPHGTLVAVYRAQRGRWQLSYRDADYRQRHVRIPA